MSRTSADSVAEKAVITNTAALQRTKNVQNHDANGVDFGFIVWIVAAVTIIAVGAAAARRSARLGWVAVGLVAAGGCAMMALGVVQGEDSLVSTGLIGIGAALALAGASRYWRRDVPPPRRPVRA